MTNTEAIEILHGRKLTMSMGFLADEKEFVKSVNEAIDMAISALEKQEGKKPKYSDPFYDDVGSFAYDVSCPTCGKKLDAEDICPKCGQRIDWSDEHGADDMEEG